MKVNNHISYLLCLFCRVAHNNILGFLSTFYMVFCDTCVCSFHWKRRRRLHKAFNRSFNSFSSSVFSIVRLSPHTHAHIARTKSRLSIEPHINMKVLNEWEIQTVITCVFVTHALCSVRRLWFSSLPQSARTHTPSNKMEYKKETPFASSDWFDSAVAQQ